MTQFSEAQQALFTQLSDCSRLACSAVLCASKCVFRVWREGIASCEPQGSATKSFYFAQRPQVWWNSSLRGGETREHFVLEFCLKWFFEKTLPPLHCCILIGQGGTYSGRRKKTGGNIFKLVLCFTEAQHWENLKEEDKPRHFGYTKLLSSGEPSKGFDTV